METDWREVGTTLGLALLAAAIVYGTARYIEQRRETTETRESGK